MDILLMTVYFRRMAEAVELPFGLMVRVISRNDVFDGIQIPHRNGQILGEIVWHNVIYGENVAIAVQKWLNQSSYHWGR